MSRFPYVVDCLDICVCARICLFLDSYPRMYNAGSPWKQYVDPIQDVICYHHIENNIKILEYDMTDSRLREIFRDNLYGVAAYEAKEAWKGRKAKDWDALMTQYYANRCVHVYFAVLVLTYVPRYIPNLLSSSLCLSLLLVHTYTYQLIKLCHVMSCHCIILYRAVVLLCCWCA